MKFNPLTQFVAAVACFATCSVASAQEAITLQEDGSLKGKAFVAATDEAVDAKISLTQDGKIVSTVATDEKGNFSFANVEPGVYSLQGLADPYVGSADVSVAPFSGGGCQSCSSCNVGFSSPAPEVAYSSCGSAPAQAFAAAPCNCAGGGGGLLSGGGGGGLGGFGGGGLVGGGGGLLSRPLLGLGVVGGIVAIAVSDDDDDDDDVSPSN